MDTFSPSLTVLSAMITPAVLISACGPLVLSASQRLGRVIERVQKWSDRLTTAVAAASSPDSDADPPVPGANSQQPTANGQ